MKLYGLMLLLLSCLVTECAAQALNQNTPTREWRDLLGTSLTGDTCKPAENTEDKGSRICKGFEGYSLLAKGEESKPEIYLIAPNGLRHHLQYWDTSDPKYQNLPLDVLWTIVHVPKKTIALTFSPRITQRDDYNTYSDSYDIIIRVKPGPVCIIGSVPVSPNSVGESIGISSNPGAHACLAIHQLEKQDWFLTARRLASAGDVKGSEAALQKIKGQGERFIVYREISNAQARANDLEGARRTLMTARNEALKKPYVIGLVHSLGQVIYGLTEAGIYEAAKSNIKLLDKSDRLQMYISVAWLQGERKDFEGAKITLREARQLELNHTKRRDSNLVAISNAQARLGLKDEAMNTASMIRDPDLRSSAESYRPARTLRPK